jgi:tRNA uridine 5-carboxymethylaminomethyl modification enzyme
VNPADINALLIYLELRKTKTLSEFPALAGKQLQKSEYSGK